MRAACTRPSSRSELRWRKTTPVKVEIWSDVICPWCGLGQHRLERGIAAFEHRDEVEVVHRSFQLDPTFPETPRPVKEVLRRKYGLGDAQLGAMTAQIESLAASEGLAPYSVGENLVGNTGLAHELLAMASDRGLEDAAWKRLYRAYFGERRSIFELDELVALGEELGLDPSEVRAALHEGWFRAKVSADDREARALGATGVPFVVVDRRYAVAGAQSAETFRSVLEKVWSESAGPAEGATEGPSCGPDGCVVPEGE